MNKYGYFTFDDFPADAYTSFIAEVGTRQTGANNAVMFDRFEPEGYQRWATFEQGEFDFEKPLYTGASSEKIADVSDFISDETGELSLTFQVIVSAGDTYTGSGFSIRTFNDDYTIEISVTDSDGTRSKTFDKTEDEFYPMPYNGLQSVNFIVRKVQPYHFMSLIGFSFGAVRKLQEADFVDEPEIVNHFDVKSEDLEYDTLDLHIRGDKNNFNPVAGERITYSKTKQEFYISTFKFNNDGTLEISCYDNIWQLEQTAHGMVIIQDNAEPVADWLNNLIANLTGIRVQLRNPLVENQKWAGYFETMSSREAARLMLQGNGLALQRKNNSFNAFAPNVQKNSSVVATFNEADIVGTPEIEIDEQVYKVRFTKYKPKVDRSEWVEAYHGDVDYQENQTLDFGEPIYRNSLDTTYGLQFYAIISEDQDNPSNDDIQRLDNTTVVNNLVTNWGTNYSVDVYPNVIVGSNPLSGLVIKGYPYKIKEGNVSCSLPNVPAIFRENIVELSDCTVMIYDPSTDVKPTFRNHLRYIYSLNKKVTFTSIRNAVAGDYVRVKYDDYDFYGWISQKTDHLNGVYEYEVVTK